MYFMPVDVHGHGDPGALAKQLKPAIDLIDGFASKRPRPTAAATPAGGSLDTAALAAIIGHPGDQNGAVYKITMLEGEMPGVLASLRNRGLNVVAIHHHMTDTRPVVIFLHDFGTGRAGELTRGVRAAVNLPGGSRTR